MYFPIHSRTSTSTFSSHLLSISCTSLSSVCGRLYFHIWLGCCIRLVQLLSRNSIISMYYFSTCDTTVHSPYSASGRSPHLVHPQYDDLHTMLQTWRSLPHGILRIYSRWVLFAWFVNTLQHQSILFQCCIPCFEGLLPAPHDNSVQKLLYLMSYWHSLAKLRVHSETTLKVLDHVTALFARALCHFKEVTCPCFNTVETDYEYQARCHAAEQRMSRQWTSMVHSTSHSHGDRGKRPKNFNLLTSKLHALGDYVEMIKMFGTMDSYSTQIVSVQSILLMEA